jgi:hypothetical protein
MKNQEVMDFPSSIYEFLIDYSFKDSDEVYTNGILLIPTFRVKQAIEHYFEQTRWIPCDERLPECHEEVLVTCADEVGIAWYRKFGHWLSNDFGDKWLEEHPPVAWMPLPEPYKIPAQTFGCAED